MTGRMTEEHSTFSLRSPTPLNTVGTHLSYLTLNHLPPRTTFLLPQRPPTTLMHIFNKNSPLVPLLVLLILTTYLFTHTVAQLALSSNDLLSAAVPLLIAPWEAWESIVSCRLTSTETNCGNSSYQIQMILSRSSSPPADVIQATGDAVCIFKELQCLTPRGR